VHKPFLELSADPEGLAATSIDLVYDRLIVRRIACQKNNRVRFGKPPGKRSTSV
jgi:hypothetical protein